MPLGSHGDMHPFLAIAAALKARGHCVTMICSGYYEDLVRRMGLEIVPLETADAFLKEIRNPDVWHWRRGFAQIGQSLGRVIPLCFNAVADRAAGKTVLVYSSLAFGARIAQEKLGLPGVSVHLSPTLFRSVHTPPILPMGPLPSWFPAWGTRAVFWWADARVLDPIFATPINAFRAQIGLAPVRRIFKDWIHSPQCTMGLFPDWYAPPQPDWPKQAALTGFPLFDEKDQSPMTAEVSRFLDAGTPPIVFTPGSAMYFGEQFFAAAVDACTRLGRRGLLLTRHGHQIPAALPDHVLYAPYVPFSQVLPRAAAVVHHGGIGSTAQALAAGVPQLMMPMGYDQPDNATRIRRFGVGDALPRRKFAGKAVAAKLDRLLTSVSVAAACKRVAEHFKKQADPLSQTVTFIEQLSVG